MGLKTCKDLYLQAPFVNLESYKRPEEISRLKTFFISDHHEDYIRRLIPLIPFVPYRLKDKIETFHLKILETFSSGLPTTSFKPLSLQISSRFIKEIFHFKRHDDIFPYLFSISWTHIYIQAEELEDDYVNMLEKCYNTINEIYTQKIYKTYIKVLKLNPSYSLNREVFRTSGSKLEEFSETYKSKVIKFLEENTPAIILGIPKKSIESEFSLIL